MKKRYAICVKNKLRLGLLISLSFLLSSKANGQMPVSKQWEKTFGSKDVEHLEVIRQTSDGGYILGGYATEPYALRKLTGHGAQDYWAVKIDADGNKVWDKFLGGSGKDMLYDLIETHDGSFILGGLSTSDVGGEKSQPCFGQAGSGFADFWVVKTDGQGRKLWDKTFGGGSVDILKSLQETADGAFVLAGQSGMGTLPPIKENKDPIQANPGFWLLKTDGTGNLIWQRSFWRSPGDELIALQKTTDQGYILGGTTRAAGNNYSKNKPNKNWDDIWIIKTDAEGNKSWDKLIGGKNWDRLQSLHPTPDGGYLVTGNTEEIKATRMVKVRREQGYYEMKNNDWGPKNYWIVKLDKAGKQQWEKVFPQRNAKLAGFQPTPDGGFLLIENHGPELAPRFKPLPHETRVVKLNPKGKKTWEISVTQNEGKVATDLQLTSDGGFILGGNSHRNEKDEFPDFWVVKYGPGGY